MEPVTLTLSAAAVLGFSFGAGPCNVSCLPYLGPVFLGSSAGSRAWRLILPFSAGRLVGYALLGLVAGSLGENIAGFLDTGVLRWLLALGTLLVGVHLFWRAGTRSCGAHAGNRGTQNVMLPGQEPLPGGLFLMGAGMALNPCAPLSIILLAAATAASASWGLGLGLSFGVGAVMVPALVFGFGIAYLGQEIRQHLNNWLPLLEKGAALLLIILGLLTAAGWIVP